MIKRLLSFVLLVSLTFAVFAQPAGYYDNATGKTGAELKTALFNIISNHTARSYDNLWTDFQSTDKRADGKVWDMYSNCNFTFGTDQDNGSGGTSECEKYNREHSFPKSWFNDATPMYTDLFHLYPTDKYVNNTRSNYIFGEVSSVETTFSNGGKFGTSTASGSSLTVFEPTNEYKGDFARTYFYMATCYEDKIASWASYNTEAKSILAGNPYPAYKDWYVQLLLKWNAQDPVSTKEIDRNNAVYAIQNNRNPFIDHPEYVNEIWGGGTATLSFTSTPVTTATQGQLYSYSVKTTGPNIAVIDITTTTTPDWLTISTTTSGNATLSGTPTASGSFDVTLSATDGTTTKTQSFTIVVAALEGLKFTSTPTTSATVGAAYSYSITTSDAAHSDATISISATTKPAWLNLTDNLNGTATLSGTPLAGDVGSNAITLSATDHFTTVNQDFNITVIDPSATKTETFTNMPTNASNYAVRSWTGDNNISWSSTQARTDQVINGRAICFQASGAPTLTSQTIPGGCSSVSFKSKLMFNSTVATITLFINNQQIGQPFNVTSTIQTATFNAINVSGNVVIKLVSNGASQIGIDDLSWTGYTAAPNVLPSITNILNNPSTPLTDQEITVSATITDSDGTIQEAYIMWGTTSGSLTNKVSMALNGGSYKATIPAQSTAGTIYYTVSAKDNSGDTKTSDQQNFAVMASNALPVISNITINPSVPLTGQAIVVSANITDTDGSIQQADVKWGISANDLSNTVDMTYSGGKYNATIPAQSSATTIYLSINAKDNLDATSQALYNFAIAQNQLPTISNFAINPTNPTTGQAITVSVNLADADGTVQEAWIDWGVSANSLTNKVDLSLSAGAYGCLIPAQSSAGTIYLAVTVKDNVLASATATFNFNVTQATGIDENKMSSVKIYPNPAKNSINIEINEQKVLSIIVSNIIGETLVKMPYNGGKQPVDISVLKPGVYFVTVTGDDFRSTVRIVKY